MSLPENIFEQEQPTNITNTPDFLSRSKNLKRLARRALSLPAIGGAIGTLFALTACSQTGPDKTIEQWMQNYYVTHDGAKVRDLTCPSAYAALNGQALGDSVVGTLVGAMTGEKPNTTLDLTYKVKENDGKQALVNVDGKITQAVGVLSTPPQQVHITAIAKNEAGKWCYKGNVEPENPQQTIKQPQPDKPTNPTTKEESLSKEEIMQRTEEFIKKTGSYSLERFNLIPQKQLLATGEVNLQQGMKFVATSTSLEQYIIGNKIYQKKDNIWQIYPTDETTREDLLIQSINSFKSNQSNWTLSTENLPEGKFLYILHRKQNNFSDHNGSEGTREDKLFVDEKTAQVIKGQYHVIYLNGPKKGEFFIEDSYSYKPVSNIQLPPDAPKQ